MRSLVTYLSHTASFHSNERIAPSNRGIKHLGRGILLGLEFLVAADIITIIAVESTVQSLLVFAEIVLIRTLLSCSFEVGDQRSLALAEGAVGLGV